MTWLYLIILIFSALTICFMNKGYQQQLISKKAFAFVSVMEVATMVIFFALLVNSL